MLDARIGQLIDAPLQLGQSSPSLSSAVATSNAARFEQRRSAIGWLAASRAELTSSAEYLREAQAFVERLRIDILDDRSAAEAAAEVVSSSPGGDQPAASAASMSQQQQQQRRQMHGSQQEATAACC